MKKTEAKLQAEVDELLRGLAKVRGEWSLICTTHNLLKLWRATGGEIAYATG